MKMTIINKVRETIIANKLIEKGDHIIVGASGGPDSQFLIYLLNQIKEEYKTDLREASYMFAIKRIAQAMKLRGWY